MIEIQCTAQGVPLADIPEGTVATIQKGTTIYCYDDMDEYFADIAIKLPEKAENIARQNVSNYVARLDEFCHTFIRDMKVENILLGIGQADTKVVQQVTDITAAALNAVSLGSLRVALELIAAIPADQLDGHFLTEARLTAKRNEIEVFLGITKSKAYNE